MAGIALGKNPVGGSGPGLPGQSKIVVLFIDGTGFFPVYEHQHFRGGAKGKHQPLPSQLLRDGEGRAKPAVFPLFSPFHANGSGHKGFRLRLGQGNPFQGGKILHRQGAVFSEILFLKLFRPDPKPVFPLPAHIDQGSHLLFGIDN